MDLFEKKKLPLTASVEQVNCTAVVGNEAEKLATELRYGPDSGRQGTKNVSRGDGSSTG